MVVRYVSLVIPRQEATVPLGHHLLQFLHVPGLTAQAVGIPQSPSWHVLPGLVERRMVTGTATLSLGKLNNALHVLKSNFTYSMLE